MILFTTLLIALAILAAVVLTIMGVIGGSMLVIFGDLIVCVFIIACIIKLIRSKK